jgi:hypothetical protein
MVPNFVIAKLPACLGGRLTDNRSNLSLRKQAHHAVSLLYEMGHLSGRKTRNGTSYGKSAAYGQLDPMVMP